MWDEKDAIHVKGHDINWWWDKARMEIVYKCMRNIFSDSVDKNILEIGAGYGSMTKMLLKFGKVKAIEPYLDAKNYLENELKVSTYHGTIESFTEKEKYDIVTCFDVLEHIENDRDALLKMESLIKDNGFLIITVPAYMFLWNRHDERNHHYRRYTKNELLKKVSSNFIVKKVSYFNTLLFFLAVIDKLLFAKNKKSYALNPNKIINGVLYKLFSSEKAILRYMGFPFGVSILLIVQKRNGN